MTLWRVLADADHHSASEPLDMLLFLKQNPQIPTELFLKSVQASDKKPKVERPVGGESDCDVAGGDVVASGKEAAKAGDTMDGQETTRVNWIELCFYLAVQLQAAATGTNNSSGEFPIVLTKKQRELWRKKKIKLILDVFSSCCERAGGDGDGIGGAENQDVVGVCCAYDGVRELKNGEVKWVFLCDLFLSELQEIRMERWLERKNNKTVSNSNTDNDTEGIRGKDVDTMLQKLAQTSLGAGISAIDTSNEAELVATLAEITKRVIRESTPTESPTRNNPSSTGHVGVESLSSASGIELNADAMKKLEMISAILRDDYQTRRELVLERCDVTLRSFEWSKKLQEDPSSAQEMKDELANARAKLTSTPVKINVEQLIATGSSASSQTAKLSVEELQIGSSVRNLLIGPVPDRGGRTTEVQAKEMKQQAKNGSWKTSKRGGTLQNESFRKSEPAKKVLEKQ